MKNLIILRKEKNITQLEIAKYLKISQSTYATYENNKGATNNILINVFKPPAFKLSIVLGSIKNIKTVKAICIKIVMI